MLYSYRKEGPQHGKGEGQERVPKASMVRFPASGEQLDVNALLGRLAEQDLKARSGGRQ
jgi:hypothetical protein